MKSQFKKYTPVGPGGMSCACCAPQSGNKYAARARAVIKRQAKRAQDRELMYLITSEMEPDPMETADPSLTPVQQLMIATYEGMIEHLQHRIESVKAGRVWISSDPMSVEQLTYDPDTKLFASDGADRDTPSIRPDNSIIASNRLAEIVVYDSFDSRIYKLQERKVPGL